MAAALPLWLPVTWARMPILTTLSAAAAGVAAMAAVAAALRLAMTAAGLSLPS